MFLTDTQPPYYDQQEKAGMTRFCSGIKYYALKHFMHDYLLLKTENLYNRRVHSDDCSSVL